MVPCRYGRHVHRKTARRSSTRNTRDDLWNNKSGMEDSTEPTGVPWHDYHNPERTINPNSGFLDGMELDPPTWGSEDEGDGGDPVVVQPPCVHCGRNPEGCTFHACPNQNCRKCDHDPVPCRCRTCDWCHAKAAECNCRKCAICQHIPMNCRCLGPDVQRVRFSDAGRGIQKFDIVQNYDPAGQPVAQGVFVDPGDADIMFVVNNPIPGWYQRYDTMKNALSKTISDNTAPVTGPYNLLADKMQYQFKVWDYTRPDFVWPKDEEDASYTYVRTRSVVSNMVTQLSQLPTDKPYIAIDMEASNLGHRSGLCLLQIRDSKNKSTFLVDLLVLQKSAFNTTGKDTEQTLRAILENPTIQKLIFDVRQDSCAMYGQAGIKLQGMVDLQIMYMITDQPRAHRTGMAKAVENKLRILLTKAEWESWIAGKTVQHRHDGKSLPVWQQRPLPAEFQKYAAGDVEILDRLYTVLKGELSDDKYVQAVAWTAVEVMRTWCDADDWHSSRGLVSEGFRDLFRDEYGP